jgi:hypothetical protein
VWVVDVSVSVTVVKLPGKGDGGRMAVLVRCMSRVVYLMVL